MIVIWKYPLDEAGRQTLLMPRGARVLCVQVQADEMQLWALVDDRAPNEPRNFAVYGTGHDLPGKPGEYLGTVQLGAFVWHVFEIGVAA